MIAPRGRCLLAITSKVAGQNAEADCAEEKAADNKRDEEGVPRGVVSSQCQKPAVLIDDAHRCRRDLIPAVRDL